MTYQKRLNKVIAGVKRGAHWLSEVLTPQKSTRWWLATAAFGLTGLAGAYASIVSQSGAGAWVDGIIGALIAIVLAMLAGFALWLSNIVLQRAGRHVGFIPVAAILVAAGLLAFFGSHVGYFIAGIGFVGVYLVVVALLLLVRRQRLIAACAALLVGGWMSIGTLSWLVTEKDSSSVVAELLMPFSGGEEYRSLVEQGEYQVEHFTYGSGNDKRRREYADDVRFVTESVDGSKLLESWSGWRGRMRTRAWGFGPDQLPLNAQVWYPALEQVDQALPLTLIVHGNSNMFNRSELGYTWLAEHLASRGHIVASVDENFLNLGGFLYDGLFPENDARGWLLLEHLKQWQGWNEDDTNPFYGKVDLERITLMGHSRGGEAVYLAGVFNQLPHYPDNALIEFDYNFGISGIVAIAPVDGQFRPSGKAPELRNTNFFTIHGGHDSDAFFFHGDRQYHRTQPDYEQGQFKASLYMHHANHGQFNTQWGSRDYPGIYGRALNTSVLLSGEEQRQVAKAYFTAFVEYDGDTPDPMFCAPEQLGSLLATDLYAARCQSSARFVLADFEQGLDVTEGSADGVVISAGGLALWKEAQLPFRSGHRERAGVWLGWDAENDSEGENGEERFYQLTLPPTEMPTESLAEITALSADSVLYLEITQMDQDPPGYEGERDGLREAADFMIELEDRSGNVAQVWLSDVSSLLPPLPAKHTRDEAMLGLFSATMMMKSIYSWHQTTESVMQTVQIPLHSFAADGVQLDQLSAIRLRFERGAAVIIIDEISVR